MVSSEIARGIIRALWDVVVHYLYRQEWICATPTRIPFALHFVYGQKLHSSLPGANS